MKVINVVKKSNDSGDELERAFVLEKVEKMASDESGQGHGQYFWGLVG